MVSLVSILIIKRPVNNLLRRANYSTHSHPVLPITKGTVHYLAKHIA